MPTLQIQNPGRGRHTAKNASLIDPGDARDSLNLLHNIDQDTVALRRPIGLVNATRAGDARSLMIADLVKSDLTRVKLQKIGANLYTFTNTFASTPASILASMDSTHLPGYCTANGFFFIADWHAKNYISNGTSAGTNELQKDAPTGVIALASSGSASGNAAGTVYYSYTDVDPTTGAESPPYAVGPTAGIVTRTVDQGVTVTNTSLSFTAPYTQKKLYRTLASGTQMYFVAEALVAASFPYDDTSLDSALTTASEVHGANVTTASINKPAAAKHCCFHRGRVFLANFSGAPSRIRWSKIQEPTQWSSSTDALFDVGKNDGGEITGLVSFRGAMIIFKTNSIWIMNGDVAETGFTFAPAVTGTGCVAPRTIVQDGDRAIYFLSAYGVRRFDLGPLPEAPLSDRIRPDLENLEIADRADFFCAGIDPFQRTYEVAVTPDAASSNTKVHVYAISTGSWGRYEYGMAKTKVSCYSSIAESPVQNAQGDVKLYLGDESGFVYETNKASTGADGEPTNDVTGSVTSSTATTTTCSAATFMTTGGGLLNMPMTLRRAADATYETVQITTNTATVITHGGWVGTAPVSGDTVFVGAIQATLSLGRIDLDTDAKKRWVRLAVGVQKQTHTIPLRIGYTIDGDTAPTAKTEYTMSGFFARLSLQHRRAISVSPYFDIIGVDYALEVLSIEIEYEVLANRRRPVR